MARSDTEQAVLDVLQQARGHVPSIWLSRYANDGLSVRLERLWRLRYPNRRNRPTHRNISRALANLVREGVIEHKRGELLGDLYRIKP